MPQPLVLLPPTGSDQEDEWIKLGITAHMENNLPKAESYYRQALRLNPRSAIATQNLAILYANQPHQVNEGLLAIERAALFDGVEPTIHANRALMCLEADRIDEALAAARHAVSISGPKEGLTEQKKIGWMASRLALAMIASTAGVPHESVKVYNEMLEVDPAHPQAGPNSCFAQTLTDCDAAQLAAQRKKWWEANHFKGEKRPHNNDKNPDRPLRVGYVGGDFKRHSAAMIFGNVIYNHTDAVEVYLYSSLPVDPTVDDMTGRFQAKTGAVTTGTIENGVKKVVTEGGRWRDISANNDEEAEAMIWADKIDILVDLAAHTAGGRLTLFTRKPAPVQVTAWGFAHGTSCPEIDYFFADPVAVPTGERHHYTEKIYDLPCIVTYCDSSVPEMKGTSQLPYFKNDFITFGAYARYEKFTDECIDTFARILHEVPESKIEFKDHGFRRPYSCKRILKRFEGFDIDPKRVLFSISTTHPEHMQAYQQADLILAPFPHSGGLVSMETLYMGVPFVTLNARQPSGRSGASILTLIGRKDWIANTVEEYVAKAVALANDIPTLKNARKTLRQELMDSPAVKGYHLAVENAYRQMWKAYCDK